MDDKSSEMIIIIFLLYYLGIFVHTHSTMRKIPILLIFFIYACSSKNEQSPVLIKDIHETVYASGSVYPFEEYKVSANADGFITKLLVAEGDTIRKGQEIMIIEQDVQKARLESASKAYDIAKSNASIQSPVLSEFQYQLNTLSQKCQVDSLNYIRFKNLYEQNACSKVDFEKAKLQYIATQNDLKSKQNAYKKLKNQLDLELKNAEAQKRINTYDEENYTLKSTMDGMVYELLKEPGEAVRRSENLAVIGTYNKQKIQLVIDELDILKIKPQQKVYVKVDMFKDKTFEAVVTKVYPKLNKLDQSFRADAEFVNDRVPNLYGLSLEANILISERKQIIAIPKDFLIGNDSVLVKRSNAEIKTIKIIKGIEDFDFVEVVSGLKKDDIIIKP